MKFFRISALLCVLLSHTALAASDRPNKVASEVFAGPAPDQDGHIVALRLTPADGWHSYWENPGDAGLATKIRWTLDNGIEAGPIQWPAPKVYREGELTTYGYGDTHTLITRIQLAPDVADDAQIALKARWLVCKDICIPESTEAQLQAGQLRQGSKPGVGSELSQALQALPEPLVQAGSFASDADDLHFWLPLPAHWQSAASQTQWFVARGKMVDHAAASQWQRSDDGLLVSLPKHAEFSVPQERLEGVLSFVVDDQRRAVRIALQPGLIPTDLTPWETDPVSPDSAQTSLWLILLMAFAGGLILNLMPCVFPVLSLKAMSLARAESLHHKRQESIAYTAGVVLSFLLIAAVLLVLRAGGAALGWGFQLQNPLVVGLLATLMLLLGLALLGWTQIGMRMMGIGQGLTTQHGLRGAFFTGVLAVVVASPCSAPFMGSALGYAVLQPPTVALSIFAALGVGLAAPLAMLPWTPGLAQRLPKPGPWMETLKHWMAAPMLLTAAWLFWVLWRQAGTAGLAIALFASALIALGIRRKPGQSSALNWQKASLAAGALLLLMPAALPLQAPQSPDSLDWQAWSPKVVAQARADNRLVFVDFTADWCLSCIANERAVLNSARVRQTFEEQQVLLLKADWTQYDPQITAALAEFDRNGVPLYLLYPRGGAPAKVLPQILTRNIVQQAVQSAAKP